MKEGHLIYIKECIRLLICIDYMYKSIYSLFIFRALSSALEKKERVLFRMKIVELFLLQISNQVAPQTYYMEMNNNLQLGDENMVLVELGTLTSTV